MLELVLGKKICQRVNVNIFADHRVELKENQEKIFGFHQETEKIVERKGDTCIILEKLVNFGLVG